MVWCSLGIGAILQGNGYVYQDQIELNTHRGGGEPGIHSSGL